MTRKFPQPGYPKPLPLERVRVFPLEQRKSLTTVEEILVHPDSPPPNLSERQQTVVNDCAATLLRARENGSTGMLIYGAHLLRNGAALIIDRMIANGWITHLATNGAGTIHDWEYAWLGRSSESVEENVATGTFGTWDETGRNIHLALYAGSIRSEGYGRSLGRFITEDGADFPCNADYQSASSEHAGAWPDLKRAAELGHIPQGHYHLEHRWKHASVLAAAFKHNIPFTVHPGIGYDIISNHPMFNGALIGPAAMHDFKLFGRSI